MDMRHHDLKRNNRQRTLHLHIGIPKTASTWLQTKIFPHLDHLQYIGCPRSERFKRTDNHNGKVRFLGDIFSRSSMIWNGYGNEIFEELVGDRHSWLADGRDLMISEEKIGRQCSRPVLIAAHICELNKVAKKWGFERLNIICCIRRQDQWLASHYAQISDHIANACQKDFEVFVNKVLSPRLSRYAIGMLLDYDRLYDSLSSVVSEGNIYFLTYETLKKSPHTFLNLLLKRLDTPSYKIEEICMITAGSRANVRSDPENITWCLRNKSSRIGKLPWIRTVLKPRPKTIQLTPEITQEIINSYSAGNQRLSTKTNLDLGLLGYFDNKVINPPLISC